MRCPLSEFVPFNKNSHLIFIPRNNVKSFAISLNKYYSQHKWRSHKCTATPINLSFRDTGAHFVNCPNIRLLHDEDSITLGGISLNVEERITQKSHNTWLFLFLWIKTDVYLKRIANNSIVALNRHTQTGCMSCSQRSILL